jgi:hypothetical protein
VVSSAQQENTPSDRRSRSAACFGRAAEPWPLEMRLVSARRAYTESQPCYVAAVLADMYVRRGTIPGLRLIAEQGELRHFNPDSRRKLSADDRAAAMSNVGWLSRWPSPRARQPTRSCRLAARLPSRGVAPRIALDTKGRDTRSAQGSPLAPVAELAFALRLQIAMRAGDPPRGRHRGRLLGGPSRHRSRAAPKHPARGARAQFRLAAGPPAGGA